MIDCSDCRIASIQVGSARFYSAQQEDLKLNDIIFLYLLLVLIQEGCELFSSIVKNHKIIPTVEHFNCMVDLLGQASNLKEKEDIL